MVTNNTMTSQELPIAKTPKKKRGRKPKKYKSIFNYETEKPKKPKKRGRKPKKIVELEKKIQSMALKNQITKTPKYGITPFSISNTIQTENNNLILHLPISTQLLNSTMNQNVFDDGTTNYSCKNEPQAYEDMNKDYLLIDKNIIENEEQHNSNIKSQVQETIVSNNNNNFKNNIKKYEEIRKNEIESYKIDNSLHYTMIHFSEANKDKKLPEHTNVACYWCTENFSCRPVGLPIRYENDIFYVDGCFCSPECAAAYNFDNLNSSDIWERYGLLNLLYIKIIGNKQITIKLAPPRRTLKKFGGFLTIEEFRKMNDNYYKQFNVVYPPMISVIPNIEKIDINTTIKKSYDYVPVDENRVKKANEELILVRKKSKYQNENTLEKSMGLKYIDI